MGKSKNPTVRIRYYRRRTAIEAWVRSLRTLGKKPILVILEKGRGKNWGSRERHWITTYRAQGEPLLNICAGGNGSHDRSSRFPSYLIPQLGLRPDSQLAEIAGVDRKTVAYHRRVRNIPLAPKSTRRASTSQFQKGLTPHNKMLTSQVDLLLGTLPDRDLAQQLNVNRTTIARRREKLKISACPSKRVMRRHTKLKEEDVMKIRSTRSTVPGLAKKFNVSLSTIYRILNRETWGDV